MERPEAHGACKPYIFGNFKDFTQLFEEEFQTFFAEFGTLRLGTPIRYTHRFPYKGVNKQVVTKYLTFTEELKSFSRKTSSGSKLVRTSTDQTPETTYIASIIWEEDESPTPPTATSIFSKLPYAIFVTNCELSKKWSFAIKTIRLFERKNSKEKQEIWRLYTHGKSTRAFSKNAVTKTESGTSGQIPYPSPLIGPTA